MIDFSEHVQRESARFAEAVTEAGAGAIEQEVPSCPEWTVADLTWHLAEVQDFWMHIVGDGADRPEDYDRPSRPADTDVLDFLVERSTGLLAALERPDQDACWSWSPLGGTVGWVRRRQAHEALIHRIDVELALDNRTPIDEALAGDGIDEILRGMLDVGELPPWASFTGEQNRVVIDTGDRWWALRLGRFVGTDPDGSDHDVPALRVEAAALVADLDLDGGDTHIAGTAADLDLWLWGRGSANPLTVTGDAETANRLRATAADATQ